MNTPHRFPDLPLPADAALTRLETPFGPMRASARAGRLWALCFVDEAQDPAGASPTPADLALFATLAAQLQAWWRGQLAGFEWRTGADGAPCLQAIGSGLAAELPELVPIPLAARGTPFQQRVWAASTAIAPGRTRAYLDLACALKPASGAGAARAVGSALGRNPWWVLVPCHRVLSRDGALTGYAGGVARKAALLEWEARCFGADTDTGRARPLPRVPGQGNVPDAQSGFARMSIDAAP